MPDIQVHTPQQKVVLRNPNEYFYSEDMFPHGVQSVYVHPKSKFILTIVAPGKYYFAVRKQNQIDIETENSYGYIVRKLEWSDFMNIYRANIQYLYAS